jgi:ABC-type branched-subunit amino acid transport system substrate-binding protein
VRSALLSLLIVLLPFTASIARGEALKTTASLKGQQLGQQMYQHGILPSGEPMRAIINNDINVVGTSFACISCHMLSGLGSLEGGVITTPTNGKSLFIPRNMPQGISTSMSMMGYSKNQPRPQSPPARSAYNNESLASVLRGGVDPSGRVLNPVMPRYKLQDDEMALLISYLKSLSSDFSPGVDDQNLKFATVITEEVPSALQEEHVHLIKKLITSLNEQAVNFERRLGDPKLGRHLSPTGRMFFRNITLSRWQLKGPPESWRAQLEEYYRKEPVFALLGGITSGDWKPVHDFSESNRIPCLFPQTDFPVVSDTNRYTFYLSKGYYQEGESAARFLNRNFSSSAEHPVIQIVRNSPTGHALSSGFMESWRELGYNPPTTILLQPGERLSDDTLNKIFPSNHPVTLLIWDGPEAIGMLTTITERKFKPSILFISSGYVGDKISKISNYIRDITYITYPYRLAPEEEKLDNYFFGSSLKDKLGNDDVIKMVKRSYPINKILILALSEMKENFYRDYFIDLISMSKDLMVPLYERLSFGPGQRYASKGCYIIQLSKENNLTLINKSDWVIH